MKKILLKVLVFGISISFLGAVCGVGLIAYFSYDLPKISSLSDYHPPIPSQILAKDGTVLTEIGREKRSIVQVENIPRFVIEAFLAAEDDKFYEHSGVDYLGVFRALVKNIKAGRVVQGGSTITQQVAKSLLLSRERSIARKIKDFLLAQKIEEKFTKDQILFLYLNQVYLGGGYYGVKSAFDGYFGKELAEATVAEAAMVAGLLVAPGKYSPYVNPAYAKQRQAYVLSRMRDTAKITQAQYEEAVKEKIKYRLRKGGEFKAGYFTDWVRQRVIEKVGEENFLTNGFRVETTLDYELQKVAEREVLEGVKEIDKRQGYKGPLEHLEPDQWKQRWSEERKAMYEEKSLYFTLDDQNKKEYELYFDENRFNELQTEYDTLAPSFANYRLRPGYNEKDPMLEELNKGETYKAIVTKIDDWSRLVYVSVAGVEGLIPYEGFRWAHDRNIVEDRNYYSYVTRPSTILKTGDVVLVRILGKSTSVKPKVYSGYRNDFEKRIKKLPEIEDQRYLECMLDQDPETQGALVSIDPHKGEIVAFVGGSSFEKSQFNRAIQSLRQPGSSFKPFLYAVGLENGYTPNSIIIDSPEALAGVDESLNWKPGNYDGIFKGAITFRNSLEQSRNVPTIKLAQEVGVPKIIDFVNRIGLHAQLSPDLSLALGSFGVTLVDIVSAYSIFPNGGKRIRPRSIISVVDRDGKSYEIESLHENEKQADGDEVVSSDPTATPEAELSAQADAEKVEKKTNPFLTTLSGDQVYDARLAYVMTNLLRGVVLHGTGRGVRSVSNFLGGKTGTTNNYVDAWFLGFSSRLATGVWTGFDDNKTLGWPETGAKAALPIWKGFMEAGVKKYGESDFTPPPGIVNVAIDKETGEPIRGGSRSEAFIESFVEGTEPGARKEMKETDQTPPEQNAPILEDDDYYNQ